MRLLSHCDYVYNVFPSIMFSYLLRDTVVAYVRLAAEEQENKNS